MGWMDAAAIIGSSLFGSRSSENAADSASQASREASAASIAEQRRQYDQSRADYAPYLAAGTDAVNQLATDLRPGGRFASTTPFDFQYDKNDPAFTFSFDQGMRGINASLAAKGLGGSGAGIKGAAGFAENLANSYYSDAFNRYVTGFNANTGERNQLYNRLAGVAGTGQNAVGSVTSQGANAAGNIGNAYMTSAANTGNAAMAAAGARQSAFGGAANALGRMYGGYGRGSDPYSNAAMANQQYGAGNVYGYGGGGYEPTSRGDSE